MISLLFGPWAPDLQNVAFQMPDQQGPVQVPVADCLNVYYVNGAYKSLNTPVALSGSPALPVQCLSAFTFEDANGFPIPVAGVGSGTSAALAWNSATSTWQQMLTAITGVSGFNFCQFGGQLFAQVQYAQAANATTGNLTQAIPGEGISPSYITNASYGTVLGVVGQFVMIGDLCGAQAQTLIGSGAGTFFSGAVPTAQCPIYPTTVFVDVVGGTGGGSGYDNGQGVITGPGIASGTVNYDTGVVSVTFTTPTSAGASIFADSAPAYRARLQWSPIGNANPSGGWPVPLTNAAIAAQSGINDLEYAYGPIMAIAGYPLYGLVFQRNAITRAQYIGGNVVFSWQTFSRNLGLLAKYAWVQVGANVYFLSDQGWYYTDGANVTPIGTAQDNSAGMDEWFFANVNRVALGAIRGAYDASSRCAMFSVPTGSNTLPDTLLTYNTIAGRWTRATMASEMIWTDSDGSTDRIGIFDQSHRYSLLTGTPNTGYLETCDLEYSDGLTRFIQGVRPNINCTDTPTAIVGTRDSLESAISYTAAATPDAFGAAFAAPLPPKALYTRVRVSTAAATGLAGAINGATVRQSIGGPL